jgi:hypothetical protein
MRTTVDLPEPLHRIASSLARHTGRSFSATIVDLVERGLQASPSAADPAATPGAVYTLDPLTGLPRVSSPRVVTPDDVAALEDEP